MSEPVVSVVMNGYNSAEFLRQAIDSVYAQTFQDWEIVFWDSESRDETPAIAKSYDARLRFFSHERLPLGLARNKALELCRGQYVCLLDCDDVYLPHRLKDHVDFLSGHPEVGMVWGDIREVNAHGKPLYGQAYVARHGFAITDGGFEDILRHANPVGVAAATVSAQAIAEGAHFADWRMAEDFAFWLEVAYRRPARYVPGVVALYRLHGTNTILQRTEAMFDEAIDIMDDWERRLAADPRRRAANDALALQHLVVAHWLLGESRNAEARRHFWEALRRRPDGPRQLWGWLVGQAPWLRRCRFWRRACPPPNTQVGGEGRRTP